MITPGEPRAPLEVQAEAERRGLLTRPPGETIVRDEYTPALIAVLSNMHVWGGSRVFHHLRGIGTNEWRVVSALANHPGATASDLVDVLGMNKSIASRSVKVLLDRHYIAQLNGTRGSRHLYLTAEGAEVHAEFLPIALRREEILHSGLSADEVVTLNRLLVRMLSSAEALQDFERALLATSDGAELGQLLSETRRSSKAVRGT